VIEQPESRSAPLRLLADQAFSRTAGAPLVGGNAVRLLKDAAENFPAWLDAIRAAERTIFFESYIFGDDATGREFRDALAAKARAGLGSGPPRLAWFPGKIISGFWRSLVAAGASVRVQPSAFREPVGLALSRSPQVACVDGRVAYASGPCVADAWLGDPAAGKEPWRDTGVELRGPG
jgi:cardiolipin synthase